MNYDMSLNWRRLDVERYRMQELATPRYTEPKRLVRHGFKVYSQSDEDGIIQEIFKRIGTTVKLLVEGWKGLWIEAAAKYVAEIQNHFGPFLAQSKLRLSQNLIRKHQRGVRAGRDVGRH